MVARCIHGHELARPRTISMQEQVHDELPTVTEKMAALRMGDGLQDGVAGPLVNWKAATRSRNW